MDFHLAPSVAGAVMAAAAVAGGAPLFSEGLRALRIARKAGTLVERPLTDLPNGFTGVAGHVALDSPLFSPLTHQPCAGFRLSVTVEGRGQVATVEERRPFRVVTDQTIAHVAGPAAFWRLTPGERRDFKADDALTEHIRMLLERSPEAARLRRSGATLLLTEHLLAAGSICHVVGHARRSRPHESVQGEWQRTGTDDADAVADGVAAPTKHLLGYPNLWIDGGGSLECLIVSDRPIAEVRLRHTRWRMAGLVVGPLLSLAGLLVLARLAERWMPSGRP